MSSNRPVRILHITDTLGSGGVERLVCDIVRLSDPERVSHRVITFFPDGFHGRFVYAERLQRLGAYRPSASTNGTGADTDLTGDTGSLAGYESQLAAQTTNPFAEPGPIVGAVRKIGRPALHRVPDWSRRGVLSAWNSLLWGGFRWKTSMLGPPTYRILKEYFRFRPDVVHAHGFYGFTYGVWFKRIFGRPMVHSVPCQISQMIHDVDCPWMPGLYRRYNRFVNRIFIAAGYRDELKGLGVPDKKLVDINGLLDLQAISEIKSSRAQHRAELRARLGIPQDAPVALSVGRLNPAKGHDYSVKAMPAILKRIPDLHLVILGEGPEQTELEALAQKLRVSEHIHLLGFIEDPLPFYVAADIYFRSPIYEGENLSSYPAIATGLPVVGFDTSCGTDLIGKLGHGLLVPNKDAAAFAEAVVSILTLPDQGRSIGQRGVDYCYQHFDVRHDVENLSSIYASLHQGSDEDTGS